MLGAAVLGELGKAGRTNGGGHGLLSGGGTSLGSVAHNRADALILHGETDAVGTEVNQVLLVLRIGLGLAHIGLGGAVGLHHARRVERHTGVLLALRTGAVGHLLLGGGVVERAFVVLIHLKAVHVGNLAARVVVVLVGKLLVALQQIVHVVVAQHEDTSAQWHSHIVEFLLHRDDVLAGDHLACTVACGFARGQNHRRFRAVASRGDGVNGLLVLGFVQSFAVTLDHGCNLVIAQRVELIVSNHRRARLEFVKRDGFVGILQRFNLQRIGGVVDQHGGVHADMHQVDHVIIHILVETLDHVVPA